jgi:hypothetical protein
MKAEKIDSVYNVFLKYVLPVLFLMGFSLIAIMSEERILMFGIILSIIEIILIVFTTLRFWNYKVEETKYNMKNNQIFNRKLEELARNQIEMSVMLLEQYEDIPEEDKEQLTRIKKRLESEEL